MTFIHARHFLPLIFFVRALQNGIKLFTAAIFSILYVNYFCQTSGTAWIDNTGAKQGNDITVMGKNKTR